MRSKERIAITRMRTTFVISIALAVVVAAGCRESAEVDGPGDEWEHILGTECLVCGFFIEWRAIKSEDHKED